MRSTVVSRVSRAALGLIIAAVLGATAAAPAHAQLGGLKKLKSKVEQATSDKSKEPTSQGAQRSPYGEFVLEMTGPVVERFERAMAAERASMEEFTKWAATAKSKEAYESCYVNALMSPDGQKITAEYGAGMEGKSAQEATAAMQAYAKKLERFTETQCGPSQDAVRARRDEVQKASVAKALEAGGFNDGQYAILKERIPPVCATDALSAAGSDGLQLPGDGARIFWVYSPTEVQVLRQNCEKLMGLLKHLL